MLSEGRTWQTLGPEQLKNARLNSAMSVITVERVFSHGPTEALQ